jgi:hypothetical protein
MLHPLEIVIKFAERVPRVLWCLVCVLLPASTPRQAPQTRHRVDWPEDNVVGGGRHNQNHRNRGVFAVRVVEQIFN